MAVAAIRGDACRRKADGASGPGRSEDQFEQGPGRPALNRKTKGKEGEKRKKPGNKMETHPKRGKEKAGEPRMADARRIGYRKSQRDANEAFAGRRGGAGSRAFVARDGDRFQRPAWRQMREACRAAIGR